MTRSHLAVTLAAVTMSLAGCTAADSADDAGTTVATEAVASADPVASRARRWHGGPGSRAPVMTTTTTLPEAEDGVSLDADEIADLVYLREEEKLAHDVYVAMYDLWGTRVFDTISRSETNHTESVLTVLDRFEIPDPVGDNPAGVFADPDLQTLYDDLVERGAGSLQDALGVGAFIEEFDIADLRDALEGTSNAVVVDMLERLLAGSSNHLRAFVSQVERAGEEYRPQYLAESEVEAILAGASTGGRGRGKHGA